MSTSDQPESLSTVSELSSGVVELSKGLAPASSGWILAVVLIVACIEVVNYLETRKRYEGTYAYFEALETNRSTENRRLSEALHDCSDTLGRLAEKRAEAESLGKVLHEQE
jgi:hypothetical protein